MKTKFKCGIVAVAVMVAGFVAYQTYGSYGAQDNSLLMQNIEALAQSADAGESGDPTGEGVVYKCRKGEIPRHALLGSDPHTKKVHCQKKGKLSLPVTKGESGDTIMVYSGSWEKDITYEVAYMALICTPTDIPGCCCKVKDQKITKCTLK